MNLIFLLDSGVKRAKQNYVFEHEDIFYQTKMVVSNNFSFRVTISVSR